VKKVKGSFLFKVKTGGGETVEWLIDLKTGKGSVTKNPGEHLSTCLLAVTGCEKACNFIMYETQLYLKSGYSSITNISC